MEHALHALRPSDLPHGFIDLEEGSQDGSRAVKDREGGRGRSVSPATKESASGAAAFRSPEEPKKESWGSDEQAKKSSSGSAGEQGPRAQTGPTMSLDRELEVEMVHYLRCQNQELRDELERLKKRMKAEESSGSWSEVSSGPVPPPPRSPRPSTKVEDRYTPDGTKVPPGPPPADGGVPEVSVPWPKSLGGV